MLVHMSLAGERGYAMVVPPLLPYEAMRTQLDIYRASCAKHGNQPDIVWIHACHLDEDRDTAKREAANMMRGFLKGNASVLLENKEEMAPKEKLEASGYGFYASGIMGAALGHALRRDDRERRSLGWDAEGRH